MVKKKLSDQLTLGIPLTNLQGLNIPEVLQPYMQNRTFLPFVKEAPKKKK